MRKRCNLKTVIVRTDMTVLLIERTNLYLCNSLVLVIYIYIVRYITICYTHDFYLFIYYFISCVLTFIFMLTKAILHYTEH